MEHYHGWRLFQGHETRQIDGHTGQAAEPEKWYVEPADYTADVIYAGPYATKNEAQDAILELDDEL